MTQQKIFALFLILSIILLSIPGCDYLQQQEQQPTPPVSPPQPQQQEQPASPPASPPAGAPAPRAPIPFAEAKLTLSHAPKVGETAGVILTVLPNFGGDSGRNIRAWLEFKRGDPLDLEWLEIKAEEVLADDNPNWEGILSPAAPLEFSTNIRFPTEGIWDITGGFRDNPPTPTRFRSNRVRLAVQTDRAFIFSGSASVPEWVKDYCPRVVPHIAASVTLDLSEPPPLGKSADLTWSIVAKEDVPGAKTRIQFILMEPGSHESERIESEALLVEGNLQWEGPLKKDIPVSSTARIKFPLEGDWEITILYEINNDSGYDNIFLNVTEERGSWGWAEPHKLDRSKVPTPKPAPTPRPVK